MTVCLGDMEGLVQFGTTKPVVEYAKKKVVPAAIAARVSSVGAKDVKVTCLVYFLEYWQS